MQHGAKWRLNGLLVSVSSSDIPTAANLSFAAILTPDLIVVFVVANQGESSVGRGTRPSVV